MRRVLVLAALALFLLPGWTRTGETAKRPGEAASSTASDYWHTAGDRIVDAHGRLVHIAAVNWFGFDGLFAVPEGLQYRRLDDIVAQIRDLRFNAIRLPFANAMVESNPVIRRHVDANPDLLGLRALDVMDRVVASAERHGLRVILDDSRSRLGDGPEENGLWYTSQYPERVWIRDWQVLVRRYLGNATVVGVDLRNEPHTAGPGPWSIRTYLNQGSTWGPYRGQDSRATDWRLAAERGGAAVQKINPHLLIIVEGIQQYPDSSRPGGIDASWWGSILGPAAKYPVRLPVAHQLVYSPHEYGPFKHVMWYFGRNATFGSVKRVWDRHWGYLLGNKAHTGTPIFLGEFGTCSLARCAYDTAAGSQGLWFRFLLQYLKDHRQVGWAFWALNGTDPHGKDMRNNLLRSDWKTIRQPAVVQGLKQVE